MWGDWIIPLGVGKIALPLCLEEDSVPLRSSKCDWVGEVHWRPGSWLTEMLMPFANLSLTPVIFHVYNVALEPTMQNKPEKDRN